MTAESGDRGARDLAGGGGAGRASPRAFARDAPGSQDARGRSARAWLRGELERGGALDRALATVTQAADEPSERARGS